MNPVDLDRRAGFEALFIGGLGHFDDGDGRLVGRQLLDATTDGRQRGFVAGNEVPVEGLGTRMVPRGPPIINWSPGLAAAAQLEAGPSTMQHEIQIEGQRFGIEIARRVLAYERLGGVVGPDQTIGMALGAGQGLAVGRQEHLDVVGVTRGLEALEFRAAEPDAAHVRG
jgi:hypothetical protein